MEQPILSGLISNLRGMYMLTAPQLRVLLIDNDIFGCEWLRMMRHYMVNALGCVPLILGVEGVG